MTRVRPQSLLNDIFTPLSTRRRTSYSTRLLVSTLYSHRENRHSAQSQREPFAYTTFTHCTVCTATVILGRTFTRASWVANSAPMIARLLFREIGT